NALTGLHAAVGGYGDSSKANLGAIKVPDARIDRLSEIFHPRKTTFAETVFVDVPGTTAGASALDQTTLNQMRDADALALVVRVCPDPIAAAPADPLRDFDNFRGELILADLAVIEKRLERLRKERDKGAEVELLERCHAALETETPLRHVELSAAEERSLAG